MPHSFNLSARLNSPCPEDTFSIFNNWAIKATGNFPQCIRNADRIIDDCNRHFKDIHKLSALELGSLEGHLSVTFDKHFRQLTCIEGRPYHYLKALVAKELLGLKAKILCGNFINFLRETDERWDVIIATGVLYHMHNPIELIKLMSQHSGTAVAIHN